MIHLIRLLQPQILLVFIAFSCIVKKQPSYETADKTIAQNEPEISANIYDTTKRLIQTRKDYGVKSINTLQEYSKLITADSNKMLVEIITLIPDIKLDIRYATSNNFMQRVMYPAPKAFATLPAARALAKVQHQLKPLGYGLKIYDAYRPYAITVDFYEKVKDTTFVASAYKGSRHNRGCALDVTLINLATGAELAMPTPYDDFTKKANTNYSSLPRRAIANREVLKRVMTSNNFDVYVDEWWHFDYKGWRDHPIMDIAFDLLSQ